MISGPDEKRRLTSILRHGISEIMPSGKARAHSVAEAIFKIASGTWPGSKASDVIAAAAFLRDTIEGKPKESIEISKGVEVTAEMLAAKRIELESALLSKSPTRNEVVVVDGDIVQVQAQLPALDSPK